MHIVLDTNVVLSGLLWRGTPYQLLATLRQNSPAIRLFSSPPLIAELADVLTRPQCQQPLQRGGLTAHQALNDYISITELVEPDSLLPPTSSDPDDDVVLATALAAHAELIVSGDRDLLTLHPFRHIQILNAADALRMIQERTLT